MGVFLRWGVFGIIVVAALIYAYNASKDLTERRQQAKTAVSPPEGEANSQEDPGQPGGEAVPEATPQCEEEFQVAELALSARRDNQPFDRLTRHQLIAFQTDAKRRQRLEDVARKWFEKSGAEPDPASMRQAVLRECWLFSPAP
jgi:hypothetical protein